MSTGLFISASGMLAEDARVDVISNNLANVKTTGFRKDHITFRQRMAAASHARGTMPGLSLDRTAWDTEQGPISVTGRPLDLALRGEGFFQVRRDGQVFATRAGDFTIDANGRLSTADGLGLVLSGAGEPIDLSGLSRFEVTSRGEVTSERGIEAVLGLVDYDRPQALRKVGDNLFIDDGQAGPKAATPEVAQGALESSSVEPVRELVTLVAAFRSYEMNAQFLKIQDQMLQRAANDIARLPA